MNNNQNQNDNNLFRNTDNSNGNLENRVDRLEGSDIKLFGEALKESYGGMAEKFGHGAVSVAKGCAKLAVNIVKANAAAYVIPTTIRKIGEYFENSEDSEGPGFITVGGAFAGYVAQLYLYGILIDGPNAFTHEPVTESNWSYLLIPVATNLADLLIYEPVRKAVIEAKRKKEELNNNLNNDVDINDARRD
jgi:hypothetical protein